MGARCNPTNVTACTLSERGRGVCAGSLPCASALLRRSPRSAAVEHADAGTGKGKERARKRGGVQTIAQAEVALVGTAWRFQRWTRLVVVGGRDGKRRRSGSVPFFLLLLPRPAAPNAIFRLPKADGHPADFELKLRLDPDSPTP
ncbi:hypothetical protein L1887_61828 [Cichorium endivia]|nr:hypothetical protein L1887_61828 [Cichorium endivia]